MPFMYGRLGWLALSIMLLCGVVQAQDRIGRQIALLKSSSDFRVRTQAALALGSSKSSRAVAPLCGGLADGNTTVRIASAAALGRLNLGGNDCLRKRLAVEPNSSVKTSIERALEKLGGLAPVIDASTRFYLAIGVTSHDSDRSDIDSMIRQGMAKAAKAAGGFALAPGDESPEQARAVFDKHRQLKGFYLAPKLSLSYAGGRLNVKLSIAMLSYPDKNMIGQFSKTVASPTDGPDKSLEVELVSYAAEAAMKQFAQLASRL